MKRSEIETTEETVDCVLYYLHKRSFTMKPKYYFLIVNINLAKFSHQVKFI